MYAFQNHGALEIWPNPSVGKFQSMQTPYPLDGDSTLLQNNLSLLEQCIKIDTLNEKLTIIEQFHFEKNEIMCIKSVLYISKVSQDCYHIQGGYN